MIIRNKFNGYVNGNNRLYPGGGGGPTTTKSETSNIPEYARPYVERMMGSTEKQVYQYGPSGNITGFQPYKPFQGETVAGFTPTQKQAMQGISGYQLPGQTEAATQMAGLAGLGSLNASYDPTSFQNQYRAPGQYTSDSFGGFGVGAPSLQQFQMGPAERVRTQSFVMPGAANAYMSPYQQAVTDVEKREATRSSDIMQQQQQAQAVQQGAFGGSRSAIVEAERQRNLGQQLGDIQTRGSQSAFQQAQQQFNAEQQARLQAQMANQQAGLTTGQQNLSALLGVQQLGAGQDLQAQLANQQYGLEAQRLGEQSRQFGYGQRMTSAQLAAQYGTEAQRMGEQSRQFGAELGLKGYGQGLESAKVMGGLGQQQYGQEMGLLGQQYDIGAKQQAYEQQRLNQIIQDYATQQQYPFIQLGTLSNMLRGLPMQASTTQMYQAQPPLMQQAVGLAGAGANLYQAGVFGNKKEGGAIKEMASGGIASGADPYKLPGMMKKLSDDQLSDKVGGDTDPETMGIAQAEKQRRDQIRAGKPKMMAGGGVVAFAKGGIDTIDRKDTAWAEDKKPEEKKPEFKEAKKVAAPPVAKAPPAAKAPPVSDTPYQDMLKTALAPKAESPEMTGIRSTVKDYETRVAGGVEGEMERRQRVNEKFGVDITKVLAEERARQKEELKMSQEDYRKSQHLRYAQMFARFGSTPGPILKAALVSINEAVPDLLDDKARANAVRKDINKALFELDKSELLDKQGKVDAAYKAHQEAADKAAAGNLKLLEFAVDSENKRLAAVTSVAAQEVAGKLDIEQAKVKGGFDIAGKRIEAASRQSSEQRTEKENRRREDAQTVNAQKALENFEKNKARADKLKDAEKKVANLASKPENPLYIQAKRDLETLQAEKQDFLNNLPVRYPLARLGDLADSGKQQAAPSAPPTAEDIAFTAKKHGISEDEVKKKLGIK